MGKKRGFDEAKENGISPSKNDEHIPPEKKFKQDKKDSSEIKIKSIKEDGVYSSGSSSENELQDANPENSIHNFRISPEIKEKLISKNITTLFPIQTATFDYIYEGKDLIGRAKTGTGKTLAFALPVIEKLLKSTDSKSSRNKPLVKVLVMIPTRELAKQVYEEFQYYCPLSITCIYGGVPYESQERDLRRGVDIVVGTPGRLIDHIEKGLLKLDNIQYVVLDEADQMLNVGFAEAMEKILSQIPESQAKQTLLFSATIPDWVQNVARKYLKRDHIVIDLVGEERIKSNEKLEHLAISCSWKARAQILADVVKVYGSGGRAIIFADTKSEATELGTNSEIRDICGVLHGDINQAQREITLQGFRNGKFSCLVATDVAARGLDIPDVDLVVQCQPPKDSETFIHRVGRTARAGKSGTAITFFTKNQAVLLKNIEREVGIEFKRIGTPQPEDLVRALAEKNVKAIKQVSPLVLPNFLGIAKKLIEEMQDPEKALAATLAYACGYSTPPKQRSLLGSQEGYTTIMLHSTKPIFSPRYIVNLINDFTDNVGEIRLIEGGALVDVPSEAAEKMCQDSEMKKQKNNGRTLPVWFEKCTKLPEMELDRDSSSSSSSRNDGGRRRNDSNRSSSGSFRGSSGSRGGSSGSRGFSGSSRGGYSRRGSSSSRGRH